jgi:hypothetical protein
MSGIGIINAIKQHCGLESQTDFVLPPSPNLIETKDLLLLTVNLRYFSICSTHGVGTGIFGSNFKTF